jgi:hypothetical protein
MNVATFVRDLDGFAGSAKLFKVDPPMEWSRYTAEREEKHKADFVIVSAVVVLFGGVGGGPETYIFPSDEEGKVVDWLEMDGSYKGGLSHEKALKNAGYKVKS